MIDPVVQQKIDQWKTKPYDQKTIDEINALIEDNNEKELVDSFYKNLEFGTGGLRGLMGPGTNRMNKYTVGMSTQGLANYLKSNYSSDEKLKAVIAHDKRGIAKTY